MADKIRNLTITPVTFGAPPKKADAPGDILNEIDPLLLKEHVQGLAEIGERKTYSGMTDGIDKARDHITAYLQQCGIPEGGNRSQKSFSLQSFLIQRLKLSPKTAPPSLKPLMAQTESQRMFMTANEAPGGLATPLSLNPERNIFFVNDLPGTRQDEPDEKPDGPGKSGKYDDLAKTLLASDRRFNETWDPLEVKGTNIIVRIPGKKNPDKRVIIGAHYDCAKGPGANDNGTGVAALLEMARVLSKHNFENSIEIVFFTGEEEGDLGSKYYLDKLPEKEKKNIIGVYIIDMIGDNRSPGEPDGEESLDIMYDKNGHEGSKGLAEELKAVIKDQVPSLITKVGPDSGQDSDDDEFQKGSIPTVFISEDTPDELRSQNPFFNGPQDTSDKIDFAVFFPKAVRAVLAAVSRKAIPSL